MTIFLRQSTASQEIILGRFVDSTDGNTEETALTINNTDIKIWKTGATTLASKNSGGGTHIANGVYYCVLDATDTDTIGPLEVITHVTGALYTKQVCTVLDEAVYDSLFGTAALITAGTGTGQLSVSSGQVILQTGTGTGQLDFTSGVVKANVTQFGGSAATTSAGRPEVNTSHIAGSAVSTSSAQIGVNVVNLGGSAVDATSGLINANVKQISTDAVAADNLEAMLDGTGGVTLTAAVTGNITGNLSGSVGSVTGAVGSVTGNVGGNVVGSVASVTGAVGSVTGLTASNLDATISSRLASASYTAPPTAAQNATAVLTTQMTESYATDGSAPTLTQAVMLTQQILSEGSVAGTTMTVKKVDGSTTAATFTLNDATTPTSITRAS